MIKSNIGLYYFNMFNYIMQNKYELPNAITYDPELSLPDNYYKLNRNNRNNRIGLGIILFVIGGIVIYFNY